MSVSVKLHIRNHVAGSTNRGICLRNADNVHNRRNGTVWNIFSKIPPSSFPRAGPEDSVSGTSAKIYCPQIDLQG